MITVEEFVLLCKEANLSHEDMDSMDIGGCIDYIDTFITHRKNDKKLRTKKASQDDYDRF